jgi:hypothetical protein
MTKSSMTKSMNVKSLSVSLTLVLAGVASASAQDGPTMQEKMACRGDAESLCAQHIGKPAEMNACPARQQGEALGLLPQGRGSPRRLIRLASPPE